MDLAGSERLGKTLSVGETQVEAMYINKSLTFLEQAVIALADRRRDHVPFRQSKLTHVLKDSIGGKCNTLLIANIWGEAVHIEETVKNILHCLTKLRFRACLQRGTVSLVIGLTLARGQKIAWVYNQTFTGRMTLKPITT